MTKKDPALDCPNPRLISAVYFGLLSVVGTVLTNAFLTSMGVKEAIPLFQAVILGMFVSACTGAIMGERIIHCPKPYKTKTFFIGFTMVIASLPVFDLGLFLFMIVERSELLPVAQLDKMIEFYLFILAYTYISFGVLLAICSGVAAMFLRGQLVYDILSTYLPKKKPLKLSASPLERSEIEHSDRVSIRPGKTR
ncbi:hypothetical protein [Legionella worsleiensis]|uniref:Uncharacterized protein n=1 Tax=Legionella worsleiensis TaxID=45076 RepID=A0A0W1A3S3_9GAMM|nr:hypothetical protein [Legionella worsleiensis]KTD76011.1 hypothetical protein Lwor_2577 [Legionella worsleiensis]STY33025.1 Uncharacterised protein [Legionella worsleiensis]